MSLAAYPLKLKDQLGAMLHKRRTQKALAREVEQRLSAGRPIKLVVGAGPGTEMVGAPNSIHEDWLLTDYATLNALEPADWANIFDSATISRVFAEHVVEHWTTDGLRVFLTILKRYLDRSGNVRIAVPDGFHPDPAYIEQVKPGGTGPGADDHKVLYNYQTLTKIFVDEKWDCELLEYFDEEHGFHSRPWDRANGFVERAALTDPRNEQRPLTYTSLILDARPRNSGP
jgi:predicted SAM-dependent methyltransferase